jgi:hypothetical protein
MPDLARLRDEFPYFAHVARGRPLAEWQAHDLSIASPFLLLLWGRQMGKSLCLALRALWRAYATPACLVLVVSGSGMLGSRRISREVRLIAAGSPLLAGSAVDEQAGLLRLSNGSEIRSVAASEGSIRGWSADELILDEAHLISDDLALSAALPTVSAREGARVVAAGTASVASGWWYDMCRRAEVGEEGYRLSRRVSRLVGGDDHAPWQNPTIVAARLRSMGSLRADAEDRCIWASGADSPLTRRQVDAITADFEVAPLHEFWAPARLVASLDPAATHDVSAMVGIGRLPAEAAFPVFVVAGTKTWAPGTPLTTGNAAEPGVAEEIAALPCAFDIFVGERNGLGEAIVGRSGVLWRLLGQREPYAGGARQRRGLRVIHAMQEDEEFERERRRAAYRRRARALGHFDTAKLGVHVDATVKATMASAMATLVQRQQLVIRASDTQLRSDLLSLQVDLNAAGEERVTAPRTPQGHADLASALMLAMVPVRRRTGWACRLSELADPSKVRLPEPARRDLPTEPVVETGGGLVLPRRPAIQSAAGPEVSMPGERPEFPDVEAPIPEMRRPAPGERPLKDDARRGTGLTIDLPFATKRGEPIWPVETLR